MRWKWLVPFAVVVLFVVPFAMSPMFHATLASVPLGALGQTVEAHVDLAAGTRVLFGMHADHYSYRGGDYVLLDVDLLHAGAVVGKVHCEGFELGGSGCGSSETNYNADCEATAPAGGVDAVRATTSLEDRSGSASFEGLFLEVKRM